MSNISSMSRESKKRQLRRQIVPSSPGPAGPGAGRDEEDSHEVVQRAHRKVIRRRLKILLIFLVIAAVCMAVVYQFSQYHQYEGYQVSWEKELTSQTEGQTDSSFCGYKAFGGGILRYTRDGMSFLDHRGNVIWNQSYEMKSPIVSVNGNYAVVARYQIQQRDADFAVLDETLSSEAYAVGFKKGNTELRDKVQSALEEMAADGTMKEISEKWFGEDLTVIGK